MRKRMMMMLNPYPGITIDPETKEFTVLGHHMIVGTLEREPYRPEHTRRRDHMPTGLVHLIEETNPGFFERPSPELPESIQGTILCGENGWWVEFAIFPGGHGYEPGLWAGLPGEPYDDPEIIWDDPLIHTLNLFRLWRRTCRRTDAPPEGEYEPGPFGGLEPGTWIWHEEDDTVTQ